MRHPVELLLDPWRPTILRFLEVTGLRPLLERVVAWLTDRIRRGA